MKYAIRLYSQYTGERVACLGGKYESREAAHAYANQEVCLRCHRIDVIAVPDNAQWTGREKGYQEH